MSDSINALLQGSKAASLAQPDIQLVNPLAAITAGNQAASQTYDLRAKQAQSILGGILQQSTDANGNVDYQKAHTLAAQAGPIVQMGMAKFAGEASALRGAQIEQAHGMHGLFAESNMDLLRDASDANVNNIIENMKQKGVPVDVAERARARLMAMSEPERRANAYQFGLNHLDQMRQLLGETKMQGFGDVMFPTRTQQPSPTSPGGSSVVGPGYTVGPSPGSTTPSMIWVDPRNGQQVAPGTPGAVQQQQTVPVITVPGVPPGGRPVPQQGGGSSQPSVTPPPPPSGNTTRPPRPPPGTRSDLLTRGGVQMASADNQAPAAVGAPSPASPYVPADVAAIQSGIAQARATPSAGGTQTAQIGYDTRTGMPPVMAGPPQGQPERVTADVAAYNQDRAAEPDITTRTQNLAHAWDALTLLQKLNSTTGVSADTINAVRSRLGTLGLLPQGSINIQTYQELFRKYTEKAMIDAAGGSSTNLGKEMAEKSSPGSTLGMQTNFEVMRNNLATDLQKLAAIRDHKAGGGTGPGYLDARGDISRTTDPRGFVWNMYSPEEQARISAQVKQSGEAAVRRLSKAIGMAKVLELAPPGAPLEPPPNASTVPGRGSFLTPPPAQPQINPLTLAG